jgi:mRNA interferase MazF
MRRGDVYRAVLDPVVGSEQAGVRPVIVVSRDSINATGVVAIIVPVTDRLNKKHIYRSHVELKQGEGGLTMDSVALCEQVRAISHNRLQEYMGHISLARISQVSAALRIALDV